MDLLLFAELVFVLKELEAVKDVLHSDQRIGKELQQRSSCVS